MTSDAEQRISAYLDWEESEGYIASIHDMEGARRSLEIADLRDVLAQLAEARRHAERLNAYRDLTRAADRDAWTATNKRTAELEAQLAEARGQLELAEAERDQLRRHIDDSIARQADIAAQRAQALANRAAYIAQFATPTPATADATATHGQQTTRQTQGDDA